MADGLSPVKPISAPVNTHQPSIQHPLSPMPDALRLDILRTLREAAGLSQTDMARLCGLQGRQSQQTAGAWERGNMTPHASRRGHFLTYLWDHLRLRQDPIHFAAVWEILVEEWAWEPLSDREWQRFTKHARPGLAAPSSTPRLVPSSPPFQAPAMPPHFVERAATMAQIAELLSAPDRQPMVALVGMGGVGKTTLATQAAHQLREQFADGVLWAHTAVSTPLDILNSWARAFGYDYSGLRDVESCAAALRSTLAEKQLLLILDNVDSAQAVRPLFLGGKHGAVLLTTRSEDVAVAVGSQVLPLTELAPGEGVQLLTNLLGKARVDREPADAATICQLVHHLPLAVEIIGQLLAARSRRPLSHMAQRLQDVQYRLDLQISDREVRTSFLVSWEALDAAHRRVFTQLALFAGRSFTAAALAAVLGDEVDEVTEQLDTLVARSLVSAVAGDRYRQHPLLADFAREQLGDAPPTWQRFAASQLDFARQHQQDFAALEPEWDNLMAGMETAHRLQQWQLVIDYADTLTEPWLARARYILARQGYAWAVEAAEMLQNRAAFAHYQIQLGFIWCELSDFAKAVPKLQSALATAIQAQLAQLQADAQYHLARIALEQGAYEECDTLLSNCEAIREAHQDTGGIAKAIHLRGILALRAGKYVLAQQLGKQALLLQEAEKDIPGVLGTYYLLTDCALAAKDYNLSEQYGKHALAILAKHPRKAELAETYFSLAMTYRYTEASQHAWFYIERSRELAEHIGSRAFLAYIFYEQSRIKFQMGEVDQALQLCLVSLARISELNDEFNLVICLRFLGDLHQHRGETDKAVELWQKSERLAIELRHPEIHVIRARLGKV